MKNKNVYWNSLEKPENVSVVAEEGDIVEIINGVAFLLQTKDEYNNIVAYRVEKNDKSIVWTLLEFCKILYSKYYIEYVRVEGDKGKYSFLERLFTKKEVVKRSSPNCTVRRCHLRSVRYLHTGSPSLTISIFVEKYSSILKIESPS